MKCETYRMRATTQEKQAGGEIQIRLFAKIVSALHFFNRSRNKDTFSHMRANKVTETVNDDRYQITFICDHFGYNLRSEFK